TARRLLLAFVLARVWQLMRNRLGWFVQAVRNGIHWISRCAALALLPKPPHGHLLASEVEGRWLAGVLLRYVRETLPPLKGPQKRHVVHLSELVTWLHNHPYIDAPDVAYVDEGLRQLHAISLVTYLPKHGTIVLMKDLEQQVRVQDGQVAH